MEIQNQIELFDTVSLDDLKKVKLLNRRDTKYVIPIEKIDALLVSIREKYRVLQIEADRSIDYDTIYYDTCNYDFYSSHQNGKKNRFKVRYRTYLNNNQSFLEVKKKNNKSRTDKIRKKLEPQRPPDPDSVFRFIKKEIQGFNEDVQESLKVHFSRITLCDVQFKERVTLDRSLTFLKGDNKVSYSMFAIVEVKQDKLEKESPIMTYLRENKYQPFRISKYCLGISALCSSAEVKRNLMKRKVHLLSKRINKKVVI